MVLILSLIVGGICGCIAENIMNAKNGLLFNVTPGRRNKT